MKWYKHLSDSGDDPDIQDAMNLFGKDGYYVFFRTLEVLSREFDENNPGVSTFSLEYFSKRFHRMNWRSLAKVLQFFHERGRFLIQYSENKNFKEITIKCIKLKDLTDEYTTKLLKQKSGVCPDNVPTIEEEVRRRSKNITNTDQEKIQTLVSLLSKEKSIPKPNESEVRAKLEAQAKLIKEGKI